MNIVRIPLKLALCRSFGGFSLCDEAERELASAKGMDVVCDGGLVMVPGACERPSALVSRDDQELLRIVEKFGRRAGSVSDIRVVAVTVEVSIDSFDGLESLSAGIVNGGA